MKGAAFHGLFVVFHVEHDERVKQKILENPWHCLAGI
jgi:hypothetical protein